MHEGLFISYRRSDSQSATGRLADHLRQNGFGGEGDMFLDIDQRIPPGMDFRVVINETLAGCDLVIVVIGPRWLDASDSEGRRRLDRASDTHRLEVAAALNSAARVVPVLVEGAGHPSEEKLPDDLKDLAYLQSWSLGERNYAGDVESLAHEMLDARRQMEVERAEKDAAEKERAEAAEREQVAAAEKERERLAAEAAERERAAAAEKERAEAAAAEQERQDRERAEAAAAEKERERVKAEKAERERLAAEKERQRLAAEEAEREQAGAAEKERERLAAEEAEREQAAATKQERQDRERAEAAAAEKERERLAAEAAVAEKERGRLAAEEASADEERQQKKRDEAAADEFARLSALHDQGTLTNEEYAAIVAKEAAADEFARLSALHDQGRLTDEEHAAIVAKEKELQRRLLQEAGQSPLTGSSEDGEVGLSHTSRPSNVGIMSSIAEIGMKWVIPGLLALWLGLLLIGTIRGYPVLITTSDDFHRDPTWGFWVIAAFVAVVVGGLSFLGGWAVSRYRNSDADTTELLPRTRPDDFVGMMLRITEIGMKWVIPGLLALWLGLLLIGTIRGYAVLVWTADDFDRSHFIHDAGSFYPTWGSFIAAFIAVIVGGLSFLGGWAVSKYGRRRQ